MDFDSVKYLKNLLANEDDSESDDELPKAGHSRIGPGHIGPRKRADENEPPPPKDPNEIWDENEIEDISVFDEDSDPRRKPEYDIKFRQSVSPEDVYLQMGCKTPLTSSCEDMVLTIDLPNESRERVSLNVQNTRIDLRSPLYRLGLPLPHEVDPDSGTAKWDEDKKTLTIVLRITREFDYINF